MIGWEQLFTGFTNGCLVLCQPVKVNAAGTRPSLTMLELLPDYCQQPSVREERERKMERSEPENQMSGERSVKKYFGAGAER